MQMQTPKTRTKRSSEGSQKISPGSVSSDGSTQRSSGHTTRQLKIEVNSSSPNKPTNTTLKSTTPITTARRSPKTPISEKKHPGRIAELETQISRLQDALKTVNDQLVSSQSWKDKAQQDAQESQKQLLVLSSKLEESQKLLAQSSSKEPHDIKDLQDLFKADDEEWKSRLETAKKLHAADLDSLAAAINEISQLKVKLDEKAKSEATQTKQAEAAYLEVNSLKETMVKTLTLVESMKNQLKDCKTSESQAQALASDTLLQLERAKKTMESLKIECKAIENQGQLRECESDNQDEEEIKHLKSEVGKLKLDLESAETRFNDEQSRRTMEIASAYELVEEIKFNSRVKESELKKLKADIEELKANLMDKETELQGICEENDELNSKLKNSLSGKRENELQNEINKLKQEFDFLKSKLMVKETALHEKSDENEKLILEIKKMDCKDSISSKKESMIQVDHLVEEIEKSNKKVAKFGEELEAAQAVNCEMEAELRRLKVQADQWRKAAEAAAAAMGSTNMNRKLMERTGSMDNCTPGSPYDDDDDELLKKKNGNVLKRIGVLWKKPQGKRP